MSHTTTSANEWIERTRARVRQQMEGEGSGHDWWHIDRVSRTARFLAEREGGDPVVVELAALLHDIADHKFHGGDTEIGGTVAADWLRSIGVPDDIIEHVAEIIRTLSFKGAGVSTPMSTLEGCIVQDADRLDAIGAIGIARAFAYGGHAGREIHNPAISSAPHDDFASYCSSSAPTINHFHEKLLLLRDRMNTRTAREIADERHAYMEAFLDQFHREWNLGSISEGE